jgi:hypothetical protein
MNLLQSTDSGKILYAIAVERVRNGSVSTCIKYTHAKSRGEVLASFLSVNWPIGTRIASVGPAIGFVVKGAELQKAEKGHDFAITAES